MLPAIKLDSCIVLQAEQPYVAEPLVQCCTFRYILHW